MKNKSIERSRREVKIYRDYYKPSFNVFRFLKSIFGVLIFGTPSVAHHYVPAERKKLR